METLRGWPFALKAEMEGREFGLTLLCEQFVTRLQSLLYQNLLLGPTRCLSR